jgi:hypothetical protein
LPLTGVNSAPVFSNYWTTFLNISYVDTERNAWHTEKTEVARYVPEAGSQLGNFQSPN